MTSNSSDHTPADRTNPKRLTALLIVLVILIIDQAIKLWVKTNMCIGESIPMFDGADWAYLRFIENDGMALGMNFVGTFALCCFRIVAIGALVWAVFKVTRKPEISWGFIVLLAMVLAGAMGNIIDNIFYGLIFHQDNPFLPAQLVAIGQGDGSALSGHVVDMFYFPIIDTDLPTWIPFMGGQHFVFFSPIFNFADASISTAGALMVLCYYKTLSQLLSRKPAQPADAEQD